MQPELLPSPQIHIDDVVTKYTDVTVHTNALSNYLIREGLEADQIEQARIRFTDFVKDDRNRFCVTHGTYNSVDGITVGIFGSTLLLRRKEVRAMSAAAFSEYLTAKTQHTLVHELKHFTDDIASRGTYDYEKIEGELKRHSQRFDRRAGAIALSTASVVCAPFIEQAAPTHYILPAVTAIGVSALAHFGIVVRGDHKAYLNSPSEVSARQAADAYNGDPLISVTYKDARS